MRYLILIYSDEKTGADVTKEQQEAMMGEYWAYTNAMDEAGARLGGEALQPTATATTVRVQNGQKITTHGPFAETKEQLGGYYLIQAENLDEAIEWAAKCPGARYGSIEVRPILEFEQA